MLFALMSFVNRRTRNSVSFLHDLFWKLSRL